MRKWTMLINSYDRYIYHTIMKEKLFLNYKLYKYINLFKTFPSLAFSTKNENKITYSINSSS